MFIFNSLFVYSYSEKHATVLMYGIFVIFQDTEAYDT